MPFFETVIRRRLVSISVKVNFQFLLSRILFQSIWAVFSLQVSTERSEIGEITIQALQRVTWSVYRLSSSDAEFFAVRHYFPQFVSVAPDKCRFGPLGGCFRSRQPENEFTMRKSDQSCMVSTIQQRKS